MAVPAAGVAQAREPETRLRARTTGKATLNRGPRKRFIQDSSYNFLHTQNKKAFCLCYNPGSHENRIFVDYWCISGSVGIIVIRFYHGAYLVSRYELINSENNKNIARQRKQPALRQKHRLPLENSGGFAWWRRCATRHINPQGNLLVYSKKGVVWKMARMRCHAIFIENDLGIMIK